MMKMEWNKNKKIYNKRTKLISLSSAIKATDAVGKAEKKVYVGKWKKIKESCEK